MADMTTTPHQPRQLLAGDFPRRFATVTILEGQSLDAGAVLGEITASGKFILSLSAAEDGSEDPSVVLWEDVDASDGDVEAEVLLCGDVLASALTVGTGHTVASVRKALRPLSLFIHG